MIWGVFDRNSRAQDKGGDTYLGRLAADPPPSANSLGQDVQIPAVVRVVAAESGQTPRVPTHAPHCHGLFSQRTRNVLEFIALWQLEPSCINIHPSSCLMQCSDHLSPIPSSLPPWSLGMGSGVTNTSATITSNSLAVEPTSTHTPSQLVIERQPVL